ncbi:MAG: transposase [Anaerolineae bacterium]|nr:transposase [Anaerolineae bacterium]
MIMRYSYLNTYPNVFLKMTGLRVSEFDRLVEDVMPLFSAAELQRLSRPDRQRELGGGRSAALAGRDQVLVTVIWLRVYPTHEVLGYLFGVSAITVGRIIQRVLPLLEQAGRDTMRMPDPGKKRRRHLDELLQDTPELAVVIDSFEQKVQRPKDPNERDGFYSGKKKTHTLKSQVAVHEETGQLVDVSESVPGPTADFKLLEQSGLMKRLPDGVGGLGDLAYLGLDKLHPQGLGASPRRKPRGQPRPPADAVYNTAFSRRRIVVENTIGRLRRYQSLTQTDRQHRQDHAARVRAVAGLVNRQLAHRMPA